MLEQSNSEIDEPQSGAVGDFLRGVITEQEQIKIDEMLALDAVKKLNLTSEYQNDLVKSAKLFYVKLRHGLRQPSDEEFIKINKLLGEIDNLSTEMMGKFEKLYKLIGPLCAQYDFSVGGYVVPRTANTKRQEGNCVPGEFVCDLLAKDGPSNFLREMRLAISQFSGLEQKEVVAGFVKKNTTKTKMTIKIAGKQIEVSKGFYNECLDGFILGLIMVFEMSQKKEATVSTTGSTIKAGDFWDFCSGCIECICNYPRKERTLRDRYDEVKKAHPNRISKRFNLVRRAEAKRAIVKLTKMMQPFRGFIFANPPE